MRWKQVGSLPLVGRQRKLTSSFFGKKALKTEGLERNFDSTNGFFFFDNLCVSKIFHFLTILKPLKHIFPIFSIFSFLFSFYSYQSSTDEITSQTINRFKYSPFWLTLLPTAKWNLLETSYFGQLKTLRSKFGFL